MAALHIYVMKLTLNIGIYFGEDFKNKNMKGDKRQEYFE